MADSVNQAIALDFGTTSIKACLVNHQSKITMLLTRLAPRIKVQHGRYESDALAYVEYAEHLLIQSLKYSIKTPSLGIAYQRSSFLLWEKATGNPVTPLISWQDNRGVACCKRLQAKDSDIQKISGLRLTPYYFAPKLNQLLQEQPQLRKGLERGRLLVGTLDSFLLWRWSDGCYYQTDASMAARTLLMDIHRQHWSDELGALFNISHNSLPEIQCSTRLNQNIIHDCILQSSIADQSAALYASIAGDPGDVLVNLGTGGFVIRYLPEQDIYDNDYLQTLVYQDYSGTSYYAIEATLNAISTALSPYPYRNCQIEDLAEFSNIFCLAEPAGLGAPYFRNDLGLVFSESISALSPQQIGALVLEGIIFRVTKILEDFHQYQAVNKVLLSGGLSESACLQQGLAQCCQAEVYKLIEKESTLLGAGLLALGLYADVQNHSELIPVISHNSALRKKYQLWTCWFDQILIS